MQTHELALVRGKAHFETLIHRANDAVDPGQPWRLDHVLELRSTGYASPIYWRWFGLAYVTAWDATTLGDVRAVLEASVPSGEPVGELPPLERFSSGWRSTAAHPRAFRGTKHRPPKRERRAWIDLHPYLLSPRHVEQVLAMLGGLEPPRDWIVNIQPPIARKAGGWRSRFAARDDARNRTRRASPRCGEPSSDDAHATSKGRLGFPFDTVRFEPSFGAWVLPALTGAARELAERFASLYRSFELDRQPELRATLVGVIAIAGEHERALGWWRHLLIYEQEKRLDVARMLYASRVTMVDPAVIDLAFETELPALDDATRWEAYRGIAAGATPAYLRSGLELASAVENGIVNPPAGKTCVTALVLDTLERLAGPFRRDGGSDFWQLRLWRVCGELPEVHELLASPAFAALEPRAAHQLLRFATCSEKESPLVERLAYAAVARRIAERAAAVDQRYQVKLVDDVTDVFWGAGDDFRRWRAAVENGLALAMRTARPPFGTTGVLGVVFGRLIEVPQSTRTALLAAPDASFLRLERACLRVNDARIHAAGLFTLAKHAPELTATTFASEPATLLATADALATLSPEERANVVAEYAATSLAEPLIVDAPIERLCQLVEPIVRAGGRDPLRRALRRHLAGRRLLTEAQLRGHRRRIVEQLDVIRLWAIRITAERRLAARVGPNVDRLATPVLRHAAAMLREVDEHRRTLRKLLAAYVEGDRSWRLRHPLTRAWLARHPQLDLEVWLRGIELRAAIVGFGDVRLAVETDPLEALKLGTNVGSCLGRGGSLAYSAAAVVLDVNKLVVYARDSRGTVVARQLLAISEANELVCFYVYSLGKPSVFEPVFAELDRGFAARLGLPIASSSEYEIAQVLSHRWWDDCRWTEPATA